MTLVAKNVPFPALVEGTQGFMKDVYSQARRWQNGYSDCSSWVGKALKANGYAEAVPGGSTTLSYLSSSKWKTIARSSIGAGDICVNSSHMIIITSSGTGVGQQRPGRNVQQGSIDDLMSGTGTYIFKRYTDAQSGGINAPWLSTDGSSSSGGTVVQAGLTDIPSAMSDTLSWLSNTVSWLRIGMVLAGAALILNAAIGTAKTAALGKAVMGSVKGAVKNGGKA